MEHKTNTAKQVRAIGIKGHKYRIKEERKAIRELRAKIKEHKNNIKTHNILIKQVKNIYKMNKLKTS